MGYMVNPSNVMYFLWSDRVAILVKSVIMKCGPLDLCLFGGVLSGQAGNPCEGMVSTFLCFSSPIKEDVTCFMKCFFIHK